MAKRWQGVLVSLALLIAATLIIIHPWDGGGGAEEVSATLRIAPQNFTLQEGKSTPLYLSFVSSQGLPIAANISWQLVASGNTGSITYFSSSNTSATNASGHLRVTYHAPADVNVLNHSITITAAAHWQGTDYIARAQGIVYPVLHTTKLSLAGHPGTVISGETIVLHSSLRVAEGTSWAPLAGKRLSATFFLLNGSRLIPWRTTSFATDAQGMARIPFFMSDVNTTTTVVCWVRMPQNLTGEVDYAGCDRVTNITVIPERPGDFPVVLIHGWGGSVSNWLLNYTWWNLSQKLQQHGHTVLDFDPSTPGIQFLRYDPGWQDHHISWIAARVNDEIERALVMNGYPPHQTIDIVAHSMGGLVARFLAEHRGADVDYWNESWTPGDPGHPWFGDGIPDITIGGERIDDLIVVGTPCHGVPPNVNASLLNILGYLYFPWWACPVQDMIYTSKFLDAMGYQASDLVDYYAVGGDIGFMVGPPRDFNGDGIPAHSDGLVPTESPYLEDRPLYVVQGKAWPQGDADHISLIAINDSVHRYILDHLC